MVSARGKDGWGRWKRVKWAQTVMEGDMIWGDEHTIQYTDDVL